MGEEKENDSHSWIGHPLALYIGAPLQAVVKSSIMSAKSTADFIQDVGTTTAKNGDIIPRNIPFVYNRNGYDSNAEQPYAEKVRIEVPLISLVKVPNLEIRKFDYSFSLEIKSVTDPFESNDTNKVKASPQMLEAPTPKLYGVISAPHRHTRHTDNSTKMQLNIQAEKAETSEGMARVMDWMNQAITPHPIERNPLEVERRKQDSPHFDIEALSDAYIQILYEKLKRYFGD